MKSLMHKRYAFYLFCLYLETAKEASPHSKGPGKLYESYRYINLVGQYNSTQEVLLNILLY